MSVAKVIILNWNGKQTMSRFLPSVVANTPPRIDIVVADNGSDDGSVEFLQSEFPSVTIISLERNYGFAEGYNRALEQIDADYCILLNSDVEVTAGWIAPLIEYLDNNPHVAAVAPKLLSVEDRNRFEYAGASGGFIDALGYPFCRGRILNTVEKDYGQYDNAREVFWATGACFACRVAVFREMEGFDASFFTHQEEIDLCWRMQLAGWRIAVEPLSTVYHLGGGTLAPSPRKSYYNFRNNLAMLYKNLPSGRMQFVISVRMILDGCAAVVYLLKGEKESCKAVIEAHTDFRNMRKTTLPEKRRQIHATKIAKPSGIYKGSIVLRYMFGKRRFGKLQ